MERKTPETSSYCNKNSPKGLDSNASGRSEGLNITHSSGGRKFCFLVKRSITLTLLRT